MNEGLIGNFLWGLLRGPARSFRFVVLAGAFASFGCSKKIPRASFPKKEPPSPNEVPVNIGLVFFS